MTFTNQIEINEKDVCYYRKAYSLKVFDTLSFDEKQSLIDFTVKEFSNDVSVAYSDELGDEIGVLTEQDVLIINPNMLRKSKAQYSLDLYLFLYKTLTERFVGRKKNFVPVIEEGYISKKWKKEEYRCFDLEIIILHLMLNELLELNARVWFVSEEREHIGRLIEKMSNHLLRIRGNSLPDRAEISADRTELCENDISIGRGR